MGRLMHRAASSPLAFLLGLALASCASPAPLPPAAAPGSSATPPPSAPSSPNAPANVPDQGTPAPPSADANGPGEPDRDIDEALRGRVLATLSQHLADDYAFADMGAQLAQRIRERQTNGSYASQVTASAFARQLMEDLQEVSKDRHLRVFFRPDGPPRFAPPGPEKAAGGGPQREGPPLDGAIHRIEVLPGNIGYLQVDAVPPLALAQGAIDAAFAFLRHTDALILDCRGNGGGDPRTVAYYLSYLTEGAPFVVNTFHTRNGGVEEFWTTDLGQMQGRHALHARERR
jgi:hypothetical protein